MINFCHEVQQFFFNSAHLFLFVLIELQKAASLSFGQEEDWRRALDGYTFDWGSSLEAKKHHDQEVLWSEVLAFVIQDFSGLFADIYFIDSFCFQKFTFSNVTINMNFH